jgi:hypothetical protein
LGPSKSSRHLSCIKVVAGRGQGTRIPIRRSANANPYEMRQVCSAVRNLSESRVSSSLRPQVICGQPYGRVCSTQPVQSLQVKSSTNTPVIQGAKQMHIKRRCDCELPRQSCWLGRARVYILSQDMLWFCLELPRKGSTKGGGICDARSRSTRPHPTWVENKRRWRRRRRSRCGGLGLDVDGGGSGDGALGLRPRNDMFHGLPAGLMGAHRTYP